MRGECSSKLGGRTSVVDPSNLSNLRSTFSPSYSECPLSNLSNLLVILSNLSGPRLDGNWSCSD